VADKEVKITAKIEGGDSSNDEYQAQLEAAIKLMNDAGRAAKSADEAIEDLLKSVSFSTQPAEDMGSSRRGGSRKGAGRPGVPKPPKFVKPPPLPGEPDEEDLAKKKTKLGKALTALQKVVTAVDGTNGHMTKTLAVLNRTYQGLTGVVNNVKKAQAQAAAANTQQAGAAQNAAKATNTANAAQGKLAKTATAAATAIGVAGTVVGIFSVAVIGATIAAKILIRIIDNLKEVAGDFSMALNKARIETEIATIQSKIRAANQVGGDLSSLEGVKKDLIVALMETKTEFIQIIEPLLTTMGDGLVAVIQSLNQGLQVLSNIVGLIENGVETILKVLSHIPIIGKAAQGALHWMQKDELDKVKGDDLNTNLEELFKEKNVYRKVPAKNSIPRRYLP
jgi:hypothetical protein